MENVFETQQCDEVYYPTEADMQEYYLWVEYTEKDWNEAEFHEMEQMYTPAE